MTDRISAEPHNLLLLWDTHFAAHQAFNASLISCLTATQGLSLIYCSDYIGKKHSCLSAVRFDWRRMLTRYSKRKAFINNLKRLVKVVIVKRRTEAHSYLHAAKVKAISAELLVDAHAREALQKQIFERSSEELFQLKHREYSVGRHFCVDMSLDCKSISNHLDHNTPQLHNLRLTAYYSCLMVEALHQFFQAQPEAHYRLLSTSVYSLDWVCRGFALSRGHEHLFLEQIPGLSPGCKVYKSYSHDLVLRRRLQASAVYGSDQLEAAINYALSYLGKRLSNRSAHTYSPLATKTSELSKLAHLVSTNPQSALWVYFTNSPDELVSISHDHEYSRVGKLMPWDESGIVQDEVEALRLTARMAHQLGASLVIRQHPRLGPEARSSFLSSEYHLLADCCKRLEQDYPANVMCFEPWDSVNSYELALLSDRVISFRGTMPLEASLLGLRPLVMAVNKGYMNYAIKLHSDTSPRTLEELQTDLLTSPTCYSPQELASFLIQFYLVRQHGVLAMGVDSSCTANLAVALKEGTSTSVPQPATEHTSFVKAASSASLDVPKPQAGRSTSQTLLIASYLEDAYRIAANAFGFSSTALNDD